MFCIADDLKDDLEQYRKNPNAQYVWRWCDAIRVDDEVKGDGEKCPLCNRPVSTLKWLEPRKMRLTNSKYPDRLTAWLSEPMVISEKVKEAYEQEGLLGIRKFIPIEVVKVSRMRKNSPKPPKYFSAEIDYTTNIQFDVAKSVIVGQKHDWSCELCNPLGITYDKIIKISLNVSGWKGEDVFKVFALPGHVFVSERFYNFVKRHNFTNFNLIPVDMFEWSAAADTRE